MGWPEAIVYVALAIIGLPCATAFLMTAIGAQIRFGGGRGPCPCITEKARITGAK